MNEALLLGSVRQHELTELAELSNARLKKEITRRKAMEVGPMAEVLGGSKPAVHNAELVIERPDGSRVFWRINPVAVFTMLFLKISQAQLGIVHTVV